MATMYEEGGKFIKKGSFVKPGTNIMEAEPFVAVLNDDFRTEHCDGCFKSGELSRCSRCQYVYYCSRNCQRQSWSIHKIECRNIKRIHASQIPDDARLVARIIIKMQNGGDQERGYFSPCEYRTFNYLMSHTYNIRQDSKKMEHFTRLCAVLYEFLPHWIIPNAKELLEIFGRININAIKILDELTMKFIGTGIYLGPSIINHSCVPNAVTVSYGTKLVVRSVRDIPSFDLTKVFISYDDRLRSVDERREKLQNDYYFWCKCEGCENPPAEYTDAACPNKNCTNPCFPRDKKCGKCNHEFPAEFNEQFEKIMALSLRHVEKMKDNPNLASLDICRMCLKKQEGLLHPLNMLHVRTLEVAFRAAESQELWGETGDYAAKLAQKYEYYYGVAHTRTAHMYFLVAQSLLLQKKCKEATDAAKKVLPLLKLALGENHPKIKEVEDMAGIINLVKME